ncbi:hypothetical protein HMPREF0970_00537 [Schaalia odontolytica F0309]|uniref:Uncharacterized protein n=1 Tax=Schaalia odontolytica F0309 TaxID=649742 RepID=D4TX80_9ACTO|nr:hypothetical protein HMPREF0970_00537 [Schaalia odontolytica F0309]
MLSDVLSITTSSTPLYPSLNAPFGAQCFLTAASSLSPSTRG